MSCKMQHVKAWGSASARDAPRGLWRADARSTVVEYYYIICRMVRLYEGNSKIMLKINNLYIPLHFCLSISVFFLSALRSEFVTWRHLLGFALGPQKHPTIKLLTLNLLIWSTFSFTRAPFKITQSICKKQKCEYVQKWDNVHNKRCCHKSKDGRLKQLNRIKKWMLKLLTAFSTYVTTK